MAMKVSTETPDLCTSARLNANADVWAAIR
jgi:hypothetical protein